MGIGPFAEKPRLLKAPRVFPGGVGKVTLGVLHPVVGLALGLLSRPQGIWLATLAAL